LARQGNANLKIRDYNRPMISYQSARQIIVEKIGRSIAHRNVESVALAEASARVLAADILADRDYPPFDRATRDGYGVRSAEVFDGAVLLCVGEIKAGEVPSVADTKGQCLHVMTGAGLPAGLDAVVMLEHASRDGDSVRFSRNAVTGQNIVRRGSEARAGRLFCPLERGWDTRSWRRLRKWAPRSCRVIDARA
jgi:molybdopterin molybdotransferase